jgi:hypothetical protein
LGHNIDASGQFHATPGQWIGGIGTKLLGLFNPALGFAGHKIGDYYYNRQQPGVPSQGQIPLNPTMTVGDLGFPGYSPNVSNPFNTSGGYDQFKPPSGDIFDPTGQFGHSNPFGNPTTAGGYAGGVAGSGHVAGGKTWLTGQDAQNFVEGLQDHSMNNAQATLNFWNRGNRMT